MKYMYVCVVPIDLWIYNNKYETQNNNKDKWACYNFYEDQTHVFTSCCDSYANGTPSKILNNIVDFISSKNAKRVAFISKTS